jgi:hypothetical protein
MKNLKYTAYWYGDLIVLSVVAVLLFVGVIVGAVWSSNEYNSQVEKCNNAGGVYIKGQCVEGKVIKL